MNGLLNRPQWTYHVMAPVNLKTVGDGSLTGLDIEDISNKRTRKRENERTTGSQTPSQLRRTFMPPNRALWLKGPFV
jgi:hypothetical protein